MDPILNDLEGEEGVLSRSRDPKEPCQGWALSLHNGLLKRTSLVRSISNMAEILMGLVLRVTHALIRKLAIILFDSNNFH